MGELIDRGMDFRKPSLGGYTVPSSLHAFMPVSARGFTLFTQQDIGQLRKGLELHYKWCKKQKCSHVEIQGVHLKRVK